MFERGRVGLLRSVGSGEHGRLVVCERHPLPAVLLEQVCPVGHRRSVYHTRSGIESCGPKCTKENWELDRAIIPWPRTFFIYDMLSENVKGSGGFLGCILDLHFLLHFQIEFLTESFCVCVLLILSILI